MKTLRYECSIENFPGFRADAVMGDTVYEVLVETKDARRLRTTLMDLGRVVASSEKIQRAVLMLEEPGITDSRLHEEWQGAASVIRPEIFSHLSAAIRQSGKWSGIPGQPAASEVPLLEEILQHELSRRPAGASRSSEAHYEILRILIHQWLLGRGPISIGSLMEISGASHPTVSRSVERLEHCLKRHSDRSVELRIFPRDEWARLVAVSDDVRATVRFVDRSGQARSPESLLRRLRSLGRQDLAVGGVWGAKHYQPSLDLIGNPRLDLSIHSARKAADLSFVERLDPALEKATRRDESPTLVIHTIRRAQSLFQPAESDLPWADPVDCLLDLHEARLESQALEFLKSFPATKGRPL
jgi:hypothetical protein